MERIRPLGPSAILIAILLLALALRLAPWGQNRFLEDEALYAYWGLQIATGADPMLDEEPVDKPPLHPYTLALGFMSLASTPQAAGTGLGPPEPEDWRETAARLPSLFASLVSIALVYALARELYRDVRVGLVAALLLALSPFDILFASTAFTDPLMTALVLGALLAAAKRRLGAAGVLAGMAVASKQQGLLFLPLVVAFGLLSSAPSPKRSESGGARSLEAGHGPASSTESKLPKSRANRGFAQLRKSGWLCFGLGLAIVAGGVVWWDLARVQRPGFLEQSLISYGGLGAAEPRALGQRAADWLRMVGHFWVSPWFNGLVVLGLAGWLVGGLGGRWAGPSKTDLALGGYVACFLGLHWLVGFQVWDRYLLGLVPLVALLAARAFVALGDALHPASWQWIYTTGLGLALVATLTGPVVRATHSELPLGGDHGAYDGIDDLAAYLRAQAPPGAVLYHYWLGYHHRFYLYGAPLRLHWYPNLGDLAHDANVYRREPRYIAFPSWRDSAPAEEALAEAGISLVADYETTRRDGSVSFRLYRLKGP
jgi:hypothetical protein